MTDIVNHPPHYNQGRFGEVECIEFTRHMTADFANAFKYIWRHEDKNKPVEDLRKSIWYIKDADAHQIAPFANSSDMRIVHELSAKFLLPVTTQIHPRHPYQVLVEIGFATLRPSTGKNKIMLGILEEFTEEL